MSFVNLVMLLALSGNEPIATTEEPPQRLSLAAASTRVASYIQKQKPQAKLGRDFAVTELTTDAVWERLKVQVVKVSEGAVEGGETFVLSGENTIRIGRSFGGDGVTSIAVADLVGDKRPFLIYAFAWGSGVHRSQIGLLDLDGKEAQEVLLTPANFSMNDYQVNEKGEGVKVLVGKVVIGHIEGVRERDALKATIKLDASVPRELLERLSSPSKARRHQSVVAQIPARF